MKRILLAMIAALSLCVSLGAAQPTGSEHGCDAPGTYPRDCLTLPTGNGTFIAYVKPAGAIPSAFNDQDVYYKTVYWPNGVGNCCSSVLVQSSLKHLSNDNVERSVLFNNGGAGWHLKDGSDLCGGAWIPAESRWVSIYKTNGQCYGVHA